MVAGSLWSCLEKWSKDFLVKLKYTNIRELITKFKTWSTSAANIILISYNYCVMLAAYK